jgi:FtsP/CotA-like multicopper oxidase with cupredoxin domain
MSSTMLLTAALAFAGALPSSGPAAHAARVALLKPRVVRIVAKDFAYEAPAEIPAGLTMIRLVNQGPSIHHIQIMQLPAGKTLQDVLPSLETDGPPPAGAVLLGGPNAVVPGDSSEVIVDLTPGNYALFCVIPGADMVPHVAKGMSASLRVTGPTPARMASTARLESEVKADITLDLVDYGFQLSQPLTAGPHMIRVTDRAEQPHEVVIWQLAPGKTVEDIKTWFMANMQGPPPARPMGGTVALSKGEENVVPVNLAPGEYALVCFVADAKDGQPHLMHGMMRQMSVR